MMKRMMSCVIVNGSAIGIGVVKARGISRRCGGRVGMEVWRRERLWLWEG